MHNQFANLAMTARKEMLTQLWILSRSEMREFLGPGDGCLSRAMDGRVDSIKTLKGWTDTSVVHFRDLAVFGEQLLLAIRTAPGATSTIRTAPRTGPGTGAPRCKATFTATAPRPGST